MWDGTFTLYILVANIDFQMKWPLVRNEDFALNSKKNEKKNEKQSEIQTEEIHSIRIILNIMVWKTDQSPFLAITFSIQKKLQDFLFF